MFDKLFSYAAGKKSERNLFHEAPKTHEEMLIEHEIRTRRHRTAACDHERRFLR